MKNGNCICVDEHEYVCWAVSHNLGICSAEVIEEDGGPCECRCHDEGYDDDEAIGL